MSTIDHNTTDNHHEADAHKPHPPRKNRTLLIATEN